MNIQEVYECIEANNTTQIIPIIEYIQTSFPSCIFDEAITKKSRIPTWKLDNEYIVIGCLKHYITIYFSKASAVKIIAENTPYCRALKGCINFSYKRDLPYDAIYQGIDHCFSK